MGDKPFSPCFSRAKRYVLNDAQLSRLGCLAAQRKIGGHGLGVQRPCEFFRLGDKAALGGFFIQDKIGQVGTVYLRGLADDEDRTIGRAIDGDELDAIGIDGNACFFEYLARTRCLPAFAQFNKAAGEGKFAFVGFDIAAHQEQAIVNGHKDNGDREGVDKANVVTIDTTPRPGLFGGKGEAAIGTMGIFAILGHVCHR